MFQFAHVHTHIKSINLLHACIGAALDLFRCSLRVYDTMEKLYLKQVTDASRQWSDLIVARTQHYWAIPVNRCTPPRRSKLINLKG